MCEGNLTITVMVAVIPNSNYCMPGSMLSAPCILSVTFILIKVFQEKHYILLSPIDEETKTGGD